jgi:hypothetical protein
MQQRQQFGCPIADIFMGLRGWFAFRLPTAASIRDRLIGASFIGVPDRQSEPFSYQVRPFNQFFFATASASLTVTTPRLRLRRTLPVSHQVRFFCQL